MTVLAFFAFSFHVRVEHDVYIVGLCDEVAEAP